MYRTDTKLYVLTGFLGSGKTTVLLKLLEILKGHRIGIIQNEFGKLGIDGTILRNDEIQMVEINRGSIFCSCLKLNFVQALAEMAAQDFEYLFVESSGWGILRMCRRFWRQLRLYLEKNMISEESSVLWMR